MQLFCIFTSKTLYLVFHKQWLQFYLNPKGNSRRILKRLRDDCEAILLRHFITVNPFFRASLKKLEANKMANQIISLK